MKVSKKRLEWAQREAIKLGGSDAVLKRRQQLTIKSFTRRLSLLERREKAKLEKILNVESLAIGQVDLTRMECKVKALEAMAALVDRAARASEKLREP